MGTSNTSLPATSPSPRSTSPSTQSGSSLAAMNWPRVKGVTLSCSSVPSSFSRATFWAESRVPISVTRATRMPGTM
jgi:hypothetical protein